MSQIGKTLVPGHTLLREGEAYDPAGFLIYGRPKPGRGKCSCGALSERLESKAARKRWHRTHKDEIRNQQ